MDINALMKQAQMMKKSLEEESNRIKAMQYEGSASSGLVKVVMTGEYKAVSVLIDESILNKEDKEMIEELVVIAINDAAGKINKAIEEGMGSMAGMLGM